MNDIKLEKKSVEDLGLDSIYKKLSSPYYTMGSETYIDEVYKNQEFSNLDMASKNKFMEKVGEIIQNNESDFLSPKEKETLVKNAIEELKKEFPSKYEVNSKNIENTPYSSLIKDSKIVKANQKEGMWLDDTHISELANRTFAKLGDKGDNFVVSNIPFQKNNDKDDNSILQNKPIEYTKESVESYRETFLKPLSTFKQNEDSKLAKTSHLGQEKFSAVMNVGNHWSSLTLVPGANGKAYVVYRDLIGTKIPDGLKYSIARIYPNAKIVSSPQKLQTDNHSCGTFSVLAMIGDRKLESKTIAEFCSLKDKFSDKDIIEKLNQEVKEKEFRIELSKVKDLSLKENKQQQERKQEPQERKQESQARKQEPQERKQEPQERKPQPQERKQQTHLGNDEFKSRRPLTRSNAFYQKARTNEQSERTAMERIRSMQKQDVARTQTPQVKQLTRGRTIIPGESRDIATNRSIQNQDVARNEISQVRKQQPHLENDDMQTRRPLTRRDAIIPGERTTSEPVEGRKKIVHFAKEARVIYVDREEKVATKTTADHNVLGKAPKINDEQRKNRKLGHDENGRAREPRPESLRRQESIMIKGRENEKSNVRETAK